MDFTLYHDAGAAGPHAQRLLRLVGAEADALGDTYRGLRAMLAGERPSLADWPVQPTVEVIVALGHGAPPAG